MLDLSVASKSTKKSYAFPFKDTSPDPVAPNPLDMLPRQKWGGKLTFPLLALNLKISFPLTNK